MAINESGWVEFAAGEQKLNAVVVVAHGDNLPGAFEALGRDPALFDTHQGRGADAASCHARPSFKSHCLLLEPLFTLIRSGIRQNSGFLPIGMLATSAMDARNALATTAPASGSTLRVAAELG